MNGSRSPISTTPTPTTEPDRVVTQAVREGIEGAPARLGVASYPTASESSLDRSPKRIGCVTRPHAQAGPALPASPAHAPVAPLVLEEDAVLDFGAPPVKSGCSCASGTLSGPIPASVAGAVAGPLLAVDSPATRGLAATPPVATLGLRPPWRRY